MQLRLTEEGQLNGCGRLGLEREVRSELPQQPDECLTQNINHFDGTCAVDGRSLAKPVDDNLRPTGWLPGWITVNR